MSRKEHPTTYRNLTVTQQYDGKWLAEVEILSPKRYKLLFSSEEEEKSREAIVKYLESVDATQEN